MSDIYAAKALQQLLRKWFSNSNNLYIFMFRSGIPNTQILPWRGFDACMSDMA